MWTASYLQFLPSWDISRFSQVISGQIKAKRKQIKENLWSSKPSYTKSGNYKLLTLNNVHNSSKLNNSLSLTVIEMNKKKFVHKMYGKHPEENSEQTLCTHCVPIGEDYLLIRVCNSFFYPLNSRGRNTRGGTSQRSILPFIYHNIRYRRNLWTHWNDI